MFEIRQSLPKTTRLTIGAITIGVLVVVWVAITASGVVSPKLLPGPMDLVASFPKMWNEPNFMAMNTLQSLFRITAGFVLAGLVAVPLGILMAAFTPVRAAIDPIIGPMRFLPIAAVVPIFILWFSFGEAMKISLLFVGTFVYLLPLVVDTVDQVDSVYLKTAATLGASKWQTIRTILLPASLPSIFEALRVMYGIGWTYVMLAEFVTEEGQGYAGIGYLINRTRRFGDLSDVLVCVALILIVGVVVDRLLFYLNRQLFSWSYKGGGHG